jgi:hypothetical protein
VIPEEEGNSVRDGESERSIHIDSTQKIVDKKFGQHPNQSTQFCSHIETDIKDYEKKLKTHFEKEDMTCAICLDRMQIGSIIVVTNCLKMDEEVHEQLHGHKFHIICFKKWLSLGIDSVTEPDTIYKKCPICRRDLVPLHQPNRF